MLRIIIQAGIFILVPAGILFAAAGRLDWVMAWIFIFVVVINSVVLILVLDPELIAERSQLKEGAKKWDIVLAILMARVGPTAILLIAGLDVRYRWSPQIPVGFQITSLVIAIFSLLLVNWALLSNRFFSGVVRIQKDRGHQVITTGPYALVRHPMYTVVIILLFAVPVALGSRYALLVSVFLTALLILRTYLEDRTLHIELDGYPEYAKQTRYRLVPGIW